MAAGSISSGSTSLIGAGLDGKNTLVWGFIT